LLFQPFFLRNGEATKTKRLVWIAPQPFMQSSFSIVSRQLLERLRGYETLYLGQHYYGEPRQEQNFTLASYFSGDHILHYAEIFKPDTILFFQSPAYLTNLSPVLQIIKKNSPDTKIVLYTPIEGYPMTLDIDPLFSTANQILVPSRYSQECLKKHGYSSEVLMHGVDTTLFKPAPKSDNFTVGSIASDVWRKQLTRIVDAHRLCLDRGFNARLLLVASTYDFAPWQPKLKKYAEKISPTAWINETAYLNLPVNQKAIASLYNQFHILTQPSTEAFGITCLEAMASGVVPLIVNHGGSPEIVGDCGIYAEISDYLDLSIGKVALVNVEDLADRIIWAHQHPQELAKLAQKGIEKAKLYNWNEIILKLEALLAD
jgi:glycosyltransferase involved in cell wall biosynthesis